MNRRKNDGKTPNIDAEVFCLRLEFSIENLRQKMMISPAPDRHVFYGMAQGMLSALRQAELSEEDYEKRSSALSDDPGN